MAPLANLVPRAARGRSDMADTGVITLKSWPQVAGQDAAYLNGYRLSNGVDELPA